MLAFNSSMVRLREANKTPTAPVLSFASTSGNPANETTRSANASS
jgi:hypothetical protein